MKNWKPALIATLAFTSTCSNAAIISHAGYSYDDTSNVVVGGGLEWMRWDQTIGMSYLDLNNLHFSGGWRLANNTEMAELFNAFQFGAEPGYWDNDRTTFQFNRTAWDSTEDWANDPELKFISMFGSTITNPGIGGDDLIASRAIFSDDPFAGGSVFANYASVSDDARTTYCHAYGCATLTLESEAKLSANTIYNGTQNGETVSIFGNEDYSYALVRTHVSPVPVPAAVWLFGSGLIGLVGMARRK